MAASRRTAINGRFDPDQYPINEMLMDKQHFPRFGGIAAIALFTALAACSQPAQKPAEQPAKSEAANSPAASTGNAAVDKVLADLPARTAVFDGADILSPEMEAKLAERVKAVEAKSGHPFAIATVRSLEGEQAETIAAAVMKKWQLNRPGQEDGMLLLVAPNDKTVFVERGIGIRPVITADIGNKIVNDIMIPAFKSGDFPAGIDEGSAQLASLLETVPKDTSAAVKAAAAAGPSDAELAKRIKDELAK